MKSNVLENIRRKNHEKKPEITARTRQRIIDSFWSVLKENGLHKMTVTSITREAGYNRGTFYEYFKDIPDLLEVIENDLMEELSKHLASVFDVKIINLSTLAKKCALILPQFDDKLFYLLGENGDSTFSYRFKKKFVKEIANYFDFGEKATYKDYVVDYCYSALIGIRLHWYENKKDLSFEELIRITQSLIATGLLGFIGQDYEK